MKNDHKLPPLPRKQFGAPKNECEVTTSGTKYYYKDSIYHREDGPAVEYSYGAKHWYQNGLLHRIGGPAVEDKNQKYFFIEGFEYTEDEYKLLMFTVYNKKVNE